jgi:G3E family GTPase
MSTRIPVTVVTGPLGSGKTTLLNRLLRGEALPASASGTGASQAGESLAGASSVGASHAGASKSAQSEDAPAHNHADVVVVECEAGSVPFDHGRIISVTGNTAVVTSACPCCAVQGEMVDALRDLFLQALHRKIPPLSHVLIEMAGTADPASAMYTLKYDRFLGERYAYRGCAAVLDGREGSGPLHRTEVQQQAALADLVIISKTDGATPDKIEDLRGAVQAINPGTACLAATDVHDLTQLLVAATCGARSHTGGTGLGLWSGRKMGAPMTPGDLGMAIVTLGWREPLSRPAFARIVDRLQSPAGPAMVRVRGRVWFKGADGPSLVNGVHQQLHVMDDPQPVDVSRAITGQPAEQSSGPGDRGSVLTLIYRGHHNAEFIDELLALAPGAESIVSPGRNFAHTSVALRAT